MSFTAAPSDRELPSGSIFSMIESPSRKNNSLRLRPFDKCCTIVKNGGEAWHTLPLECLALIEKEEGGRTSTRVVGLVMQNYEAGSFSIVSPDDDEFLSYERIDDTRDWQEAAVKQRADLEEQRAERRKEWPHKQVHQLN